MKRAFLCVFATALIASGCSKNGGFLEETATTDLFESSVFSDSARAMDFLAHIYTHLDFSINPQRFGLAGLEAATDEAEGPTSASITVYNQFAEGSVSAYSISTDAWDICYRQIRAVNQYLKQLPKIPINQALKDRTRGEALFLRAYYYSMLLKHYGGIPIVGDTLYGVKDPIDVTRRSYSDCVEYILEECDKAYALVSTSYSGLNYGRITKGACLALKARVLLYAASPLFNGGSIATEEPLKSITGYPTYDQSRWQRAADAARAVIQTNFYQLNEDNTTKPGYGFYNVFQKRVNTEFVLARMYPNNGTLEGLWRPPSRGGSSTFGASPYHNLVDAFEMNNGKPITDPTSGYDPANPYANRDPRLSYTVTHNLSEIYEAYGSISPVFIYDGEPNGNGVGIGTPTGYYGNKMCNDNVVPNWIFASSERCYPIIRYADILLMFAEATNEAVGPNSEVYAAVEAVRKRAGLVPFELAAGLTTEEMREVIQHERQVELAFEDHRFWDVRRWKIAEQTENKMMTGMRAKRVGNDYEYAVFDVRKHNFRPAMYLWAIPQRETAKSADLLQNPGY